MWKSPPEELLVGLERSQCNGKGFTNVSWQRVQIVWISSAKMCLKGLGHQMNIFWKAYSTKSYFLFMRKWFLGLPCSRKNNFKVSACFFKNTY